MSKIDVTFVYRLAPFRHTSPPAPTHFLSPHSKAAGTTTALPPSLHRYKHLSYATMSHDHGGGSSAMDDDAAASGMGHDHEAFCSGNGVVMLGGFQVSLARQQRIGPYALGHACDAPSSPWCFGDARFGAARRKMYISLAGCVVL